MARRIEKHSTRLSQVHEGALDAPFHQGQRVQTIDGLPGRILFVSASFAPGVTEYEVHLDNGMGQGTYTASQLRPVPDDYRGGHQPIDAANLPAGIRPMASETHLASDDYPEMESILHDRPDPGTQIKVIGRQHEHGEFHAPPGAFRRIAADSYGGQEDPRDEDYNGGEGDVGTYWAEPGQQAWMHENIGPQEEAPPPLMMAPEPEDLPGPLARLAQIEEAGTLWGGTFHRATTINGTTIDGAGDAPEHGTVPRASEPNDYDARSTEGDGDPKWSEPASGDADKHTLNGAMIGMYPEGISAGGGPGIEVGAFVAARVPWTGPERAHLHSWDQGVPDQGGDFVPSTSFTGKVPVSQEVEVPAPDVIEAELRAQSSQHTAASESDWADHLKRRHGYGQEGIDRILGRGDRVSDIHQGIHDAGMAKHDHELDPFGEDSFLPRRPDPGGRAASDPEAAIRGTTPAKPVDPATWDPVTRRRKLSARTAGVRVKYHGPDDFTLHDDPGSHDSPGNDLDTPLDDSVGEEADTEQDKNSLDYGDPQVSPPDQRDMDPDSGQGREPGSPAGGDQALGLDTESPGTQQELPPTAWPMTQAPVQQGGPAYTQGTHDQHGRVFPPPPPAPAPTGPDGEPLGEDSEPGEGGDGKKVQLEIKTGATEEELQDRFGEEAHPTHRNPAVRTENGGRPSPDPEHSVTDSEPVRAREDSELTHEEYARRYSSVHLAQFVAAASSPAFRFEFTASWRDVVAKAKRLRKAGRVRITHSSAGMVIGEVGGDHDVYETGIQRVAGRPQTIQHWACGCPWGSFRQDKSLPGRLNGRPCSHTMALQFEALARTRRERKVDQDLSAADLGVPHQVVVKSMPPWGAGGWAQTWLAPAASLHKTAEMFCPNCGDDRDQNGRCYGCGTVSQDPRDVSLRATATPDEARDWNWPPEERDRWDAAPPDDTDIGYYDSDDPDKPNPWRFPEDCLYQHHGECPPVDPSQHHTGESLRHSRPQNFRTDISSNPFFDPDGYAPALTATHVMTGWVGNKPVGRLHFSQSDDGRASEVHMLHSHAAGQGIGSAMMDDLYSHVKGRGGWLDHGIRTDQGHDWWASYREPHPEINTHHTSPEQGWKDYWSPLRVGPDAKYNAEASGGRGAHTPLAYNPYKYVHDDHDEMWTHARGARSLSRDERNAEMDRAVDQEGLGMPAQQATAMLLAAGEDQGDIIALAQLAGFTVQADQTNAPWGSENVTKHPPQKPYGATEPLNKDQSPASYGFLSGPDPDNWGSIQEDNALQMPLSNTGARTTALSSPEHKVLVPGAPSPLPGGLNYPSIADQEDQSTFGYTDRANTAGPSTAISPRDPQGIRMEESRDDAAEYRRHLTEGHGVPPEPLMEHDYGQHARQHGDMDWMREHGELLPEGATGHPVHRLPWEVTHGRGFEPEVTGTDQDFLQQHGIEAELRDEPEPALPSTTGDDIEATGSAMGDQSAAEGLTGGAQLPSPVTQEPGMGSGDEYLAPDDQSIQTIGQQWSGDGTDSDEVDVPTGQPQGDTDSTVAAFQRSAAAGQYSGGANSGGSGLGNGDIAQAAQAFLSKTADVLPDHEAAELISEGRGERARNLGLLRLEGTHYEDEDAELKRRGLSLDDFEDDVISA